MGWKSTALLTASVVTLGVGALNYVDPTDSTPRNRQQEQVQQETDQLGHAQESVHEQMRRDGENAGWGSYRDSLRPAEVRPPELRPRFKLRIEP